MMMMVVRQILTMTKSHYGGNVSCIIMRVGMKIEYDDDGGDVKDHDDDDRGDHDDGVWYTIQGQTWASLFSWQTTR